MSDVEPTAESEPAEASPPADAAPPADEATPDVAPSAPEQPSSIEALTAALADAMARVDGGDEASGFRTGNGVLRPGYVVTVTADAPAH